MNRGEIEKLMLLHLSSIPSPSMGIVTVVEYCQWFQKNFLRSRVLGKEGMTSPSTGTGLDSVTSPKHICQSHWGLCLHWFLFAPFNYSYERCVWCLKMTILHACHVCIKKITEALVQVTLSLHIIGFIQSKLEGKQQEKKFGDCWQ